MLVLDRKDGPAGVGGKDRVRAPDMEDFTGREREGRVPKKGEQRETET